MFFFLPISHKIACHSSFLSNIIIVSFSMHDDQVALAGLFTTLYGKEMRVD